MIILTVPHHLPRGLEGGLEDPEPRVLDVGTDHLAEEGFRHGGESSEAEEEGVEEVVTHGLPADGRYVGDVALAGEGDGD